MDLYFVLSKVVILSILSICSEVSAVPKVKITRALSLTSSDIELSWRPFRGHQKCSSNKIRYIVRYKTKGEKFQYSTTSKPFFTIEDLEPDTRYKLAVRPVVCKKPLEWSGFVEVETMPVNLTGDISRDYDEMRGKLVETYSRVKADVLSSTSVNISWGSAQETDSDENVVKGYRLSLKKKDAQKKSHKLARDTFHVWKGLKPETRYSVSVFLLKREGGKQKISTVKFETPAAETGVPQNFRIVSAGDKSLTLEWDDPKPAEYNSSSYEFVLQYKVRHAEPPELCELEVDSSLRRHEITVSSWETHPITRSNSSCNQVFIIAKPHLSKFKEKDLRPNSLYAARIGIREDNSTVIFSGWERKLTTVDSGVTSQDQLADVYTISPSEAIVFWPFLTEKTYITEVSGQRFKPQVILKNKGKYFLDNLKPRIFYNLTIKQLKDGCPYFTYAYIKTNPWGLELTSMAQTYWKMDISNVSHISENYEASLRVIELPDDSNVFLWDRFPQPGERLCILNIFEGTFVKDFRLNYVVPADSSAIVVESLNKTKDYRAILRVYDTSIRNVIYISNWLYIRALKNARLADEAQSKAGDGDMNTFSTRYISYTSTDLYFIYNKHKIDNNGQVTHNMFIDYLEGLNNRNFVDEAWTVYSVPSPGITLNATVYEDNQPIEQFEITMKEPVAPKVLDIDDVTVTEGVLSVMKACHAQGDPYPNITWKNISSGEMLNDSAQGVQISDISNVGSLRPINGSVYLASERRIDISPVTIYVSGVYACLAENIAGKEMTIFTINVKAKPPGPVTELRGSSITPYKIHIEWDPPRLASSKPVSYRVAIMDEFNWPLLGAEGTNRTYEHDELEPDTIYKFSVAAFHEDAVGPGKTVTVRTFPKPELGRPENVSITTINSTIIHVEWDPPAEVSKGFLFIKSYDVYYKKVGGKEQAEGSWNHKNTSVILTDLEENQLYEIQVIAETTDDQVSQSKRVEGSTNRDAYMDESRPPPPPLNVYLRSMGGNIIVTWLPPYPTENILVRNYAIEVYNNRTIRQKMLVGYKESSVIIYEAEMGVLYRVAVAAKNNAGQSIDEWAEIYIPQEYVTEYPVENFHGDGLSSTGLELFWDPPQDGRYSHFVLSYTIKGNKHRHLPGEGTIPSDVVSYVVRSLKPFTEYEFTITPYLNEKKGVSANVTVNTLSDVPGQPPVNVGLEVLNSTTVSLKADPPATEKNGIIEQYKISYRIKRKWRSNSIAPANLDETVNCLITNLDPSTYYEFRIRAYTDKGAGPWSGWLGIKTPDPDPVLPLPPTNFTQTTSVQEISLSWDPPDQSLHFIEGYIVGYGQFLPEVFRETISNQENGFTITGLESGTTYIVSVRSFNQFGESAAVFAVAVTKEIEVDSERK